MSCLERLANLDSISEISRDNQRGAKVKLAKHLQPENAPDAGKK